MTNVCVRDRGGLRLFTRLATVLFVGALATPALADGTITVQLDRARLIKLPERAATVVIGDPLIADLSIQPGGLAVVTGKGYGETNVIVLDKQGVVLSEQNLQVKGPSEPVVVVYRGDKRETYSCTPDCQQRITLGDDPGYFNGTLDQSTTRNTQAMAAGNQSGSGGNNSSSNTSNSSTVNAPSTASQGGVTITIRGNNSFVNPADRH